MSGSSYKLLLGDVRNVLPTLESGSVHCCVSSPPYFGLRDYGTAGQIGLEATPDDYLRVMVAVFRGVRRVLRDDGTCWVNMGDSYAGSGRGGYPGDKGTLNGTIEGQGQSRLARKTQSRRRDNELIPRSDVSVDGMKPKDLIGMPWMLAFALRADGWYLRSDIIWHKPNPMPESVTDRPTKAHEYLFLLSKSARYFYDADAIKEPSTCPTGTTFKTPDGWDTTKGEGGHGSFHHNGREKGHKMPPIGGIKAPGRNGNPTYSGNTPEFAATRNIRDVWTVATQPFPEAHFATFPEKLIEPCILAGCPLGGTVLDPFNGAGTTGVVSLRHGRNYIGIDNNADYLAMSERRLQAECPLFTRKAGA